METECKRAYTLNLGLMINRTGYPPAFLSSGSPTSIYILQFGTGCLLHSKHTRPPLSFTHHTTTMRFISIATVCFLAASSNVFAVPLGQEAETYVSRRASTSSLSSTAGDSEALSLGKVATGLGIASAAAPIVKGIFDSVFGGNSTASRRDLEELERLLKRDDLGSLLLSRQNSTADQSGSLNILSIGEDIISAIGSLLSGGSSNQQRDLVTHVARRGAAPKVSSTISESSSGSTLENVANGFSIASAAANIFHDIFGGSGNSTKRDELMAVLQTRNVTTAASADGSGAIDIGSIIQTVLSLLPIKRELADAADSESGALKLPNLEQIANGFSIASSGANILHTIFGGSSDSTQTREVIEQLLRRGADSSPDASGAVAVGNALKTLGNIGKIGFSAGSILGDVFGSAPSNGTQARELVALLARSAAEGTGDGSDSEAISFKNLGHPGSILFNGASILGDLFGGSASNGTQARELVELLSRHAEARRGMLLTA